MDLIDIVFEDRTLREVWLPTRFFERWHGMKRRTGTMLFAGSSVHGIGMDRSLTVVGIDGGGTVTAVRTLEPHRVVLLRGARFVLELEADAQPPHVGDRARFYDRRNVGTTRGVRNADRKSRRHLRASRRHAPLR